MEKEKMFCYQCQETAHGTGCTLRGVCGKLPATSARMDMLLYIARGIAIVNNRLRLHGTPDREASRFIIDALFTTITNANFDDPSLDEYIHRALEIKNILCGMAKKREIELPDLPELEFEGDPQRAEEYLWQTGVLSEKDEDVRGLKQLAMYGCKGMAAYARHALNIGLEQEDIYTVIEDTLEKISRHDIDVAGLMSMVLEVGDGGVKAMDLLDRANTWRYGNPEVTKVDIGVRDRPAILVSGHDLKDLEELLEQSAGKGIDIYTHGEMLPAHAYPFFKKYPHFAGNYGNAWWKQVDEFETFNGCFLFTSNCIVPPRPKSTYLDRVYTTGVVAYPGARHIPDGKPGEAKDFSEIIRHAQGCKAPEAIEHGELTIGFAHDQTLKYAGDIIRLIKEGKIRKFVVMAGCDGRFPSRDYYTKFAEALPKDCVILTAGCAKYRYNKLPLGDIEGIPRVLDAGQCNDSYSLVRIALALRDAFGLKDVNELPIVYNIAWYEQKAIIVLLALLSLGVKNIHSGPTLPAYFTPDILKVLKEKFNIGTITNVDADIKTLIGE